MSLGSLAGITVTILPGVPKSAALVEALMEYSSSPGPNSVCGSFNTKPAGERSPVSRDEAFTTEEICTSLGVTDDVTAGVSLADKAIATPPARLGGLASQLNVRGLSLGGTEWKTFLGFLDSLIPLGLPGGVTGDVIGPFAV